MLRLPWRRKNSLLKIAVLFLVIAVLFLVISVDGNMFLVISILRMPLLSMFRLADHCYLFHI